MPRVKTNSGRAKGLWTCRHYLMWIHFPALDPFGFIRHFGSAVTFLWPLVVLWTISVRLCKRVGKSPQFVFANAVVREVLTNTAVDILNGS